MITPLRFGRDWPPETDDFKELSVSDSSDLNGESPISVAETLGSDKTISSGLGRSRSRLPKARPSKASAAKSHVGETEFLQFSAIPPLALIGKNS